MQLRTRFGLPQRASGPRQFSGFASFKAGVLTVVVLLLTLGLAPFDNVAPSPTASAADYADSSSALINTRVAGLNDWAGWGHDLLNTRFNLLPGRLSVENVANLTQKWAFVFPGATSASSQPAIVGNTLYVGSWNAKFYALDAKTGTLKWSYDTVSFTGPLGSGQTNAVRDGPSVADGTVYFGDILANFYALDARTGALKWAKKLDPHPFARITSSPLFWQGRIYVGVASVEENAAVSPLYPCCTFRGSVVALDGRTGSEIWRYYPISQPAQPTGTNSAGTPQYGPSGGAVWSSPSIDPLSGTVFITTGNNYSDPATNRTDAIIALDIANGHERWATQLTPNDRWNVACVAALLGLGTGLGPNCPTPTEADNDFDFGGSPNVFVTFINGRLRTLVGAGQKSGIYHALDVRTGEIVWQSQLSATAGPNNLAGLLWGSSWDGQHIYVSTYLDVTRPLVAPKNGQGSQAASDSVPAGILFALDPATGHGVWATPNPSDGCTTGGAATDPACMLSLSAAASTIPGVVFEGSVDGKFRAYNSRTGAIIWSYDTDRSFTGTNGATGKGGSINGAGASIANSMVYVNSGYAPFPGQGINGNVLLAFGLR